MVRVKRVEGCAPAGMHQVIGASMDASLLISECSFVCTRLPHLPLCNTCVHKVTMAVKVASPIHSTFQQRGQKNSVRVYVCMLQSELPNIKY